MTSHFVLNISSAFSSAHSVRGYEGRCARVHGHNYKISVELQANFLDHLGFVMDYYEVKEILEQIIQEVDHYNLNTIKPFDEINPTAENIAMWFYRKLRAHLNKGITLVAVILHETEDFSVRYSEHE